MLQCVAIEFIHVYEANNSKKFIKAEAMKTNPIEKEVTSKEEGITPEQLKEALHRQRLYGGKLGQIIESLGYAKEENLENFFKVELKPLQTVEDTGLTLKFLGDLTLKYMLTTNRVNLSDLSKRIGLPPSVVHKVLDQLRQDKALEITGGNSILADGTYIYGITEEGTRRALDQMEINRYVGPAPVPIEDYRDMVDVQTVNNIYVTEENVKDAFSHLVVNRKMLTGLGAAVTSGKPIFLYGPAGNGKTTFAETIGKTLPGHIYIPYSVLVGGEIIVVYDQVNHKIVTNEQDDINSDRRWLKVQRPVVLAGGELTLGGLELEFNPISKFYEAPLQMKANNGLFIIDDFGRQRVDPQVMLNRWIVPLDRRIDYLTLHTGVKFDIPFDQLVILATNLTPQDLVDDAFLRRLRYKIKIEHPSDDEFAQMFKNVCRSNNIEFNESVFHDLLTDYYKKFDISYNACHPRDIVDHIVDEAHYLGVQPEFSKKTIAEAWNKYFV
jgi:hypothetical protein